MNNSNKRIAGYDFARGLAIIGMVYVNFKVVMVAETTSTLYNIIDFLSGKAAALFVVLAGVGMTLMYSGAKRKNDLAKMKKVKINLLKRAVFLFIIGLSYYFIWPADILHFYALYLSIGIAFLSFSRTWLQLISLGLIIGFTMLQARFNYELGWDWTTLEYTDFLTFKGFIRNLFFNGFHPVIPWLAFLLTGIWVGRLNLRNYKIRKKTMLLSALLYVITKALSVVFVNFLILLSPSEAEDILLAFGTSPMPPMPFYMVSAASLSIFIISFSVYISERFSDKLIVKQLISTGQLALTNYILHVVVGMLGLKFIYGKLEYAFTIEFSVAYASIFSILIIVFSHYWKSRYSRGPLEFLMRKITG